MKEKCFAKLKLLISYRFCTGKCCFKFCLLALLTVQNAVHVIAMRYVRVRPQPMFLSTVAVFFAELIKLLTCLTLIVIDQRSIINKQVITLQFDHKVNNEVSLKIYCAVLKYNEERSLNFRSLQLIRKQILQQPIDTLKVCVPAILYVIVGILMFTAISNLNAATFMVRQISFQLKVLSAAAFTVLLLHRRLSIMQWLSLPVLLAAAFDHVSNQKPLLGFAAVIIICIISGFAGVYLEKILKDKKEVSLWIRNIQLCIVSLPVSLISIFVKDAKQIKHQGFMVGFDIAVWLTVFLAAFGGLIVAVIIKYTDNILKAFATSFAVILSCIFSAILFNFQPTLIFLIGAVLVIAAVCVYSTFPYRNTTNTSVVNETADAPSSTAAALQSVSLINDEKQQLQSSLEPFRHDAFATFISTAYRPKKA
uniref:UDP-galactose/UDP-N-acetylglucosamine transporter srf-3 n=1 Tax=Syphacia muris TaxID=451379 RepID=A0A0N5ADV3_9BILA